MLLGGLGGRGGNSLTRGGHSGHWHLGAREGLRGLPALAPPASPIIAHGISSFVSVLSLCVVLSCLSVLDTCPVSPPPCPAPALPSPRTPDHRAGQQRRQGRGPYTAAG